VGNPAHFPLGGGGEVLWSLVPDAGAAREREEPMLVLQLTDLISRGYWCSALCSVAESSHTSWKIDENYFFQLMGFSQIILTNGRWRKATWQSTGKL